jgi:hypothetical protein
VWRHRNQCWFICAEERAQGCPMNSGSSRQPGSYSKTRVYGTDLWLLTPPLRFLPEAFRDPRCWANTLQRSRRRSKRILRVSVRRTARILSYYGMSVRFPASRFTLPVKSFHTPPTPPLAPGHRACLRCPSRARPASLRRRLESQRKDLDESHRARRATQHKDITNERAG